jgi:predicted AlkP superfamily pyrophosphatase or phosphodiesterase
VAVGAAPRPRLAVLIVVDQLRSDLVHRHNDLWTGGFRRLEDEGYFYTNATQAHAATETAVGHATLSTGVYPQRHGVVANEWYELSGNTWVSVSNVADSTVKIVGAPSAPGASPAHLMRSGLAEWVAAADPRAIVASVSGKDRGAIQPAAHVKRGYVYWFNSGLKGFVTSTYYRNANPSWVDAFNSVALQQHVSETSWDLTLKPEWLSRANPDTVPTEGNGVNTYFPHTFAREGNPSNFWGWWESTPNLDVATLEFAETMVNELGLGKDDVPDFLNVSLSATDRVGHAYGPGSREQFDNLMRLDKRLGKFFEFLDNAVGKGNWVMMLSADHGVLDSPEDILARGGYAHRVTAEEAAQLDSLRDRADRNPDKKAAVATLISQLKQNDLIGDAWSRDALMSSASADSFAVLQRRSMFPDRYDGHFSRQGVEYRFKPNILWRVRGSGHGQTYYYDRHVPMIFMGASIPHGRDQSKAETVDFSATIATLLRIPFPKDLDGKPLPAVTRSP